MTQAVLKKHQEFESTTKTSPNPLMSTDTKNALGELVLRVLSGSYVLLIKTQAVHWNVRGPLFKPVHDLTEDQYGNLFAAIDDLAERLRALGLKAPMNYAAMKASTDIEAFSDDMLDAEQMIVALAADHELLASKLAAGVRAAGDIGDPATEDLFTERLRYHQKQAWMLRAMLTS